MHWLVGVLSVAIGMIAVGVGLAMASRMLNAASRRYQRTASRYATWNGWDAWFIGGFSGLTMGMRWGAALAIGIGWCAAGAGFVGLGIRLVSRL